jgi:Kef-type K+ transport system membrane component KefB
MFFQWYRLDSPTLWIFTYLPAHYFHIVCLFLASAISAAATNKSKWLYMGAGCLALLSYYWSPFAIGLAAGSFLLIVVLPYTTERLYPLPERKNNFGGRHRRSVYISLACLLVSLTGEAISVCVAALALIFGVVIPEVIRRKNTWEKLNPI